MSNNLNKHRQVKDTVYTPNTDNIIISNEQKIIMLGEYASSLEKNFPNDYSSKYSLVTFNEDINYRSAMLRGRAQDKAILNMIADNEIDLNDDLSVLLKIVQEKTNDIIDDDNVAKTMHH